MKLTKFEHACFTVEKDDKIVVVDPGSFTTDFIVPENVCAVIVTHEHTDHFEPAKLQAIIDKNPETKIYAHDTIVKQMEGLPAVAVAAGETVDVGGFTLEFFGGKHALIHPAIPIVANLGVMIDDAIYYSGDSYTIPNKPVDVLAFPVSAPWLKMSEAMDFLFAVNPRLAFPVHDEILSETGKALADRVVSLLIKDSSIEYQRLQDVLDI